MADSDLNIDLILALADGSMAPDEAAAAEATLSAAERDELAAQRTAMAALADAPEIRLSDGERRDLRAAIRAEINLPEPAAAPASPQPTRRGTPWYVRMLPALGAAAALVVVVGVGLSVGGGDDDSADSATETTTAAESLAQPTSDAFGEMDSAQVATTAAATAEAMDDSADAEEAVSDEDLGDDGGDQAATTTTAAAADDLPTSNRLPTIFPRIGDFVSGDLEERLTEALSEEAARTDRFPFPVDLLPGLEEMDPPPLECWATAVAAAPSAELVTSAGIGSIDGDRAEFYGFDDGLIDQAVAMVVDGCEVVAVVEHNR